MITFDKETHRYFDGDKELIPVTHLMAKHGLAPDYSGVSRAILDRKAGRGTLIHKEIEEWIKTGEYGFTKEVEEFAKYLRKNEITATGSEEIVFNDICAGTADLFLQDQCGRRRWIADIKTTAKIHWDAVSWQLSIYNALSGLNADIFAVFHFDANGDLDVKEIKPKPKDEVERLFQCERDGVIFTPNTPAVIDQASLAELSEIEAIIQRAETEKKSAEEQARALKDAILRAMQQNGVRSVEGNGIKITLIDECEKKQIDTTRLKKDLPEIAEQYTKTVKTAAYLRVTIKEGNE